VNEVFLFPGQGAECPGMGGGALQRPGPVRTLVERASGRLQLDLARIVARGDPLLARTEVGQPALVAISLGLALELEASGVVPWAVAGHSVGEVAAFSIAGCLAPEEAIDAVIERARLMAEAARRTPGSMAAVRVEAEAEVSQALEVGQALGNVELAAHNGPAEWVLSGDRAALGAVASRFPTVPLPVSGAWHSRALAPVAPVWREMLRGLDWQPPRRILISNSRGRAVNPDDDLVELLVRQLTEPVRWAETLATLAGRPARWRIFGPGRVLRALCRSNLGPDVPVFLHAGDAAPEMRP